MTSPEALAEQYAGEWVISRELHWDGTRGDWTANSCSPDANGPKQLTARSIEALADQLAKASR